MKAAKQIYNIELETMVRIDFLTKNYLERLPCVCFIRRGGDNDVSRVTRGRWNKMFDKNCSKQFIEKVLCLICKFYLKPG